MPTTIPLLPVARPIEAKWKCKRSGDCCTQPHEVVMTRQERVAVFRLAPDCVTTEWREVNETLVALKARPCPFYLFGECVVYDARPYNCRRFACMRPDPKREPFELGEGDLCKNFWERFAVSREVRRLAALIQRRAQRWAQAHGWTHDEEIASPVDADA